MTSPPFRPLFDTVLLTLETPEEKAGALFVPGVAQEKPNHGTVLLIGPEVEWVKLGDRVIFTKYSGKPIEIEGEKYQYMKEAEIIGILDTEEFKH